MSDVTVPAEPESIEDFRLRILPVFRPIWREDLRWKIPWGGRGSGKSWAAADRCLVKAATVDDCHTLCVREFQTTLSDSVISVLKRRIRDNNAGSYFQVTDHTIRAYRGGNFMFDGLHHNADQIKSKEGIKTCWMEEAHATTEDSWKYLIPTVFREPDSEMLVTFNQHDEDDPTYQRCVVKPPPSSVVIPCTWRDNPRLPVGLNQERLYHVQNDPDSYEWVWGLATRKIGSSIILRGHYVVEAFNEPPGVRPRYGLDFGFANDPNALVRSYITTEKDGDHLWITHEAVGYAVELDDLPAFLEGGPSQDLTRIWEGVPGVRKWPIKADAARPETISYLARKGFNVTAAEKWPGSVEDGVAHLKRYAKIHIHQRCKHTAREARLYAYKQDPKSGDVLPIILDKNNHCWDAERYSLDGEIQHSGGLGVWAKLGKGHGRGARR